MDGMVSRKTPGDQGKEKRRWTRLLGAGCFRRSGRFRLGIFALEFFNATSGIHELLFSCEKKDGTGNRSPHEGLSGLYGSALRFHMHTALWFHNIQDECRFSLSHH